MFKQLIFVFLSILLSGCSFVEEPKEFNTSNPLKLPIYNYNKKNFELFDIHILNHYENIDSLIFKSFDILHLNLKKGSLSLNLKTKTYNYNHIYSEETEFDLTGKILVKGSVI